MKLEKHQNEFSALNILPDRYINVPCGYCYSCQKRKLNGYRLRLLYEYQKYPNNGLFITLTFDNESLKRFKSDTNLAVKKFLDRLRKYNNNKSVRHWICAEFGTLRGRIHYHGILFNVPGITEDIVKKAWKFGFIFVGYCSKATINYIVKYISKGTEYKEKLIPRILSSPGLGISFLDSPECKICKYTLKNHLILNGKPVALPRYYIDKMFDDSTKEHLIWEQFAIPRQEFYLNGKTYYSQNEYDTQLLKYSKSQIERGISLKYKPATNKRVGNIAETRFKKLIDNYVEYSYTNGL